MKKKFIPLADRWHNLDRGAIIRHKSGGESFVVDGLYTSRITAVTTIDIQNPAEWLILVDEPYTVKFAADPALLKTLLKIENKPVRVTFIDGFTTTFKKSKAASFWKKVLRLVQYILPL